MRQELMTDFPFDPEFSSFYLSCAAKNLTLIRDEITRNLRAIRQEKGEVWVGHLEDCCDAMTPAFQELERIKAELDSAAAEERSEPG